MKINKEKLDLAMAKACILTGELSKKADVNYSTLTRIKTGAETNPYTVGKIAKALGVGVEELIEDTAATVNQFESQGFRLNNKGSESN